VIVMAAKKSTSSKLVQRAQELEDAVARLFSGVAPAKKKAKKRKAKKAKVVKKAKKAVKKAKKAAKKAVKKARKR
jgi:hypothetical protein